MRIFLHREEGWTMIELILTLSLLGLLITLALPTFTRFGEFLEKEMFLKLLSTDLQYAQMQAMSREEEIVVWFDTKAGWVITQQNGHLLRKIKIPYHFKMETNFRQDQIIFRQSGQIVGGTIQLKSGNRLIGKIMVQVASGIPRVELLSR